MQFRSYCIVGGGSSGWMAAATMKTAFPECEVSLIQPEGRKIIGVGESTLGHINRFFRFLGLSDKEWMPYCNATYKSSIAFKNFREGNGERFQYPFGRIDHNDYRSDYMTFFELQVKYPHLYPPEEFARFFNPNTILAEENKLTSDYISNEMHNWNFVQDTAYHMDSEKFGEFLSHRYPDVKVYTGNVINATRDETGNVITMNTDSGDRIMADLYIDCTGFKSLILEKIMGSKFVSFNDVLFNDTAWAAKIQYSDRENQMDNYTDCVAMSNGWSWNIPLWDRVGAGYVFSRKYIDPEIAQAEFMSYIAKRYSPKIADNADYRLINIRHGKREKAWVNNVVGIGLAYGFLEPLESTGLMTTHENLMYLVDTLKRRKKVTKIDIDSYNYTVDHAIESMKYFIGMHYVLSQRDDTQYWKDATQNTALFSNHDLTQYMNDCLSWHSMLESRREYFQLYEGLRKNFWSPDKFEGLIYIAAGQSFRPINEHNVNEAHFIYPRRKGEVEQVHQDWQRDRKAIYSQVKELPTHYEYLRDNIYA